MGTVSPHKKLSLSYLKELRENNYYNPKNKKDYDETEVNRLIWEKENRNNEKERNDLFKSIHLKEKLEQNKNSYYFCNRCKEYLPLSSFSKISGKVYNRPCRSLCKNCRANSSKKYRLSLKVPF